MQANPQDSCRMSAADVRRDCNRRKAPRPRHGLRSRLHTRHRRLPADYHPPSWGQITTRHYHKHYITVHLVELTQKPRAVRRAEIYHSGSCPSRSIDLLIPITATTTSLLRATSPASPNISRRVDAGALGTPPLKACYGIVAVVPILGTQIIGHVPPPDTPTQSQQPRIGHTWHVEHSIICCHDRGRLPRSRTARTPEDNIIL